MGEYAKHNGEEIKIGTCEDMYYLRFDQRHKVQALSGNVDPVADAGALRFRFPFPDEDGERPGDFHKHGYHRGITIHGATPSEGVEHGHVQFVAQAGYNVCLPCPESLKTLHGQFIEGATGKETGVTIHRNGFAGAVQLVAQRFIDGKGLVPVLRCGGCGAMWRVENRHEIEALAVALRSDGDSRDKHERICRESSDRRHATENPGATPLNWGAMPGVFYHAIADRMLEGLVQS